jgi:hypothetical protein
VDHVAQAGRQWRGITRFVLGSELTQMQIDESPSKEMHQVSMTLPRFRRGEDTLVLVDIQTSPVIGISEEAAAAEMLPLGDSGQE